MSTFNEYKKIGEQWARKHKKTTLVIYLVLCAWLWPYSFNTVFSWVGSDAEMLWWHGVLFGLVPTIGTILIPVAGAVFVLNLVFYQG